MDVVTLALAKKYTQKSLIGLGALKGAPATIVDTRVEAGQTILTFQWTAIDGTIEQKEVALENGTPIYNWISGAHYRYGDICLYQSCFFRCTHENTSTEFNYTDWSAIGNADGNFAIVDKVEQLPVRFTTADRKMYYVVEDELFYLWNGQEWAMQQPKSIKIDDIKDLFKPKHL